MDRYQILLGKEPPKEKETKVVEHKFVRKFFIGERRSGKTITLINNILSVLSHPTLHVCYCSHNRDSSRYVVKNLIDSMRNEALVHEHYPDFENRIHDAVFGGLPVSALYGRLSALFLDNIDAYSYSRKDIPVFQTLQIVNQYPLMTVMAACDKKDFYTSVDMIRNTRREDWGGISKGGFIFQGVRWELEEVPERREPIYTRSFI